MDDKQILRAIERSARILSKLPYTQNNPINENFVYEVQHLVLLECFRDERRK